MSISRHTTEGKCKRKIWDEGRLSRLWLPLSTCYSNGKEFIGCDLEDACDCLNITLHQVPVKAPNFKGTIEREFRTLNEGLIHKLPGTTFSNVEQRGNYDSIKNAALSLDSLEKLINIFIVDIYSQRFHRGLGGIPARVWEQKTATTGFFPRLPNSREELLVLLGRVDQRSIHAYGIEFEKLIYNCDALGPIREELKGKKAKIKYHPGDMSTIHVYSSLSGDYIKVPAVDSTGYTSNLSLWKHRLIRKLARDNQE